MNPQPRTRRHIITRHLSTAPGKAYSLKDAKRDIHAVYGTGLFEDVTMVPQEAEGSTETHPKVRRDVSTQLEWESVRVRVAAAVP